MIDIIDWHALYEQYPDFVDLVGQEIDELDWYALLIVGATDRGMWPVVKAEIDSDDFQTHAMVELLGAKILALLKPGLL